MVIFMKICLLGDGGVGKTAIREAYIGKEFSPNYLQTIGADFTLRKININNQEVKTQIWDLAGQPHFKAVRSTFYKATDGAILVFDLTRLATFVNVVNWVTELQNNLQIKEIPIILVGNKLDLLDQESRDHAVITTDQGKMLAEKLSYQISEETMKVPYIETSAKTKVNIETIFKEIVTLVLDKQ